MGSGKRYSKKEYGKLNIVKVIVTILIICVAIFCIYKLVNRKKSITNKNEVKELGREIIHEDKIVEEKNKTIEDYVEQYNAVIIDKIKEDTYYVSVDGKECTLYSNGNLADGKIPLWNGESKEIKIDKDTKSITINTAEELKWFADQIISGEKNFKGLDVVLNNNLDLGGRIKEDGTFDGNKWRSIIAILEKTEGAEENIKGFAGSFDGNNHWIRGMIIESKDNYQGLFGYLNGTVRNLSLVDCYVSGNEGVGAFVGLNAGKLDNCRIENVSINGTTKVGGFVGINMTDSHIENCSTEKESSIINSSGDYAGGIVGYLNNNSDISNCENKSNINGVNYVGGLVGISFFGTEIINSSSIDSKILGKDYVGGLIGYSQSETDKCFNKSLVTGHSYIGGIAGINYVMGNISMSYNIGNIDAEDDFVGGIAGLNNATIVSTYNTGEVMSKATDKEKSVGGICGQNLSESAVNNSYNIGRVIGVGYADGVVGANFGMINNCYYLESIINTKTNMAKSEEEMKSLSLDDDFKADTNNINNGYLILDWQ